MGEEWCCQTGHRHQPGDATGDNEDLHRHGQRQSGGDKLAIGIAHLHGGGESADHEDGVEQKDCCQADEAEFFAKGREDEVRVLSLIHI